MNIKILGSGCANCKKLQKNAEEAVKKLGIEADIVKVEDFQEIMKLGVIKTPGIVINDTVKMYGKVSTVKDIIKYIEEEK